MSDPNRNISSHPNESAINSGLYGLNPAMAMALMNNPVNNANYQFFMRLSDMSNKSPNVGSFGSVPHNNFMSSSLGNLSTGYSPAPANNEMLSNFNWASAMQYAQMFSSGGCGTLNNMDSTGLWNPVVNNEQMWKALQNVYSPMINNSHGFSSPINNVNMSQFSHCDSQESFNDVLAKLGQGLNAAKKREESGIPDLLRDSVISSRSADDQNSMMFNPSESFHNEMMRDIPSSMYQKSSQKEYSRNPSPVNAKINSLNSGRGRGRPPKSSISRSSFNSDIVNNVNPMVFEKTSTAPTSVSSTTISSVETSLNLSPPIPRSSFPMSTHVSSKLVIPPTVTSVVKSKSMNEKADIDNKMSINGSRKEFQKSYMRKASSPSSIENTIDDVLKSFQGISASTISNSSSESSLKPFSECTLIEDLTSGKKRNLKGFLNHESKRSRLGEQGAYSHFQKPLSNGWKREIFLKSSNDLVGDVKYESPNGIKILSYNCLKELLNREKYAGITVDNFSFDIKVRLGDYYKSSLKNNQNFEKMTPDEVDQMYHSLSSNKPLISDSVPDYCQVLTLEIDSENNNFINKSNPCAVKKLDTKQLKCGIIKSEKEGYRQKRIEQKLIEAHISRELKKPVEDLRLMNSQELPHFNIIDGNRLSKNAFRDCLLVSEFLYSFADVLGIDSETIPTMQDYQKAFVDRDPESLQIVCWLLMELLKFAVCDPGIPNTKLITQVVGVKFSDLDVNLNTLTGVLRTFILARAVGEDVEMESWLKSTEFKDLSGEQQAALLHFVINEMLSSRLVSSEVDKILDQQSIIRRDKWILDGKLRRLRIFQSRKLCLANGAANGVNNHNGAQNFPEQDCNMSAIEVESDLESMDSMGNLTSSQLNWSGEEDEIASSSSVEDIEKKIEKLTNQVLQKKSDLNMSDHKLRGIHLGQDRYYRNFYLLRYLGGIYVEPAPDFPKLNSDPDSITERISKFNNEKIFKFECLEENKTSSQYPALSPTIPVVHSPIRETATTAVVVKQEKLVSKEQVKCSNPQTEPLDLRVNPNNEDKRFDNSNNNICNVNHFQDKVSKHAKFEWDWSVMDTATTFYANRAKLIYPEIEFSQLKHYYHQQLEDYLRDCNQENAMEHLKSWINFYQLVLRNDQNADETYNMSLNNNISNCKNDKLKELADKELQRMGKQSTSKVQSIPAYTKENWCWIRDEEKLKQLLNTLHRRGIRERNLYRAIERHYELIVSCFKQDISMAFNYDSLKNSTKLRVRSKRGKGRGSHSQTCPKQRLAQTLINDQKSEGSEPNLIFISEVSALEKIEDLIEMVVNASLHRKGWKFPERVAFDDTIKIIPSTTSKRFDFEMYPLDLAKERLLELEDQLERRYLLPPLNLEFKPKLITKNQDNLKKTLDEVVSSSCGLDDGADSSSSIVDDSRSLNTEQSVSTYISQENDKRPPLSLSNAENSNSVDTPQGLINWRRSVLEASTDQQMLSCMKTLSNAIAWDKSIMKVLCQICRKDCNEAQLLLCDSCDRGYHTYCFRPPLTCIPDGLWYCHECVSKATDQKLCYVCGQPKSVRTMVCIICKRILHALCSKPAVTRVPRKWTCHNCSERHITQDSTVRNDDSHSSFLSVSVNNCSEAASCSNSNSSIATSENCVPNSLSKEPINSNITCSNIITKKRTSKRVLGSQPNSGPKKRLKKAASESTIPKDEASSIGDTQDLENIKTMLSLNPVIPCNIPIKQSDYNLCLNFLKEILDQEIVHPFLRPVDVKKIPIYKKIIKNPMDFTTLAKKLVEFSYQSTKEFAKDLQLIYKNCEKFNEDDSEIGKAGHKLRSYFESHWQFPAQIETSSTEIEILKNL